VIRWCGAVEPCLPVCRRQVEPHASTGYTELDVECQALVAPYPFSRRHDCTLHRRG